MFDLKEAFVFDIETVPIAPGWINLTRYTDQSLAIAFESFRDLREPNMEIEDCWKRYAGITPEYSQIICFSFAGIVFDDKLDNFKMTKVKSICSENEKELLTEVAEVLDYALERRLILSGHNIKAFDIPFLIKRFLINKIKVPKILHILFKKPWEMNFYDTKEMWNFGSYMSKSTLKEISISLGLKSPKDDIDGSQIGELYYSNTDKTLILDKIAKYCEGDVEATANILMILGEN